MSMLRSRSSGGRLVGLTSPRKMVYGGITLAGAPGGRSVRNTNPHVDTDGGCPGNTAPCPRGAYSPTGCTPCRRRLGTDDDIEFDEDR
jgi:hypothetical protein